MCRWASKRKKAAFHTDGPLHDGYRSSCSITKPGQAPSLRGPRLVNPHMEATDTHLSSRQNEQIALPKGNQRRGSILGELLLGEIPGVEWRVDISLGSCSLAETKHTRSAGLVRGFPGVAGAVDPEPESLICWSVFTCLVSLPLPGTPAPAPHQAALVIKPLHENYLRKPGALQLRALDSPSANL